MPRISVSRRQAFAYSGYEVISVREFHSNIKGRHSYVHLRVDTKKSDEIYRKIKEEEEQADKGMGFLFANTATT